MFFLERGWANVLRVGAEDRQKKRLAREAKRLIYGRGSRIRTCDLLLPRQAR